ncbi:SDR family NAD(P)-dependent oxidoreductase [Sulfitobacter sp. JB4-11]|uniref:SDR family NAD(P)-dependent oxidoreductase n=1 Tax=Sulfitobacter rhodophyticola TaxID=3238304 RepID=UPI003D81AEF2
MRSFVAHRLQSTVRLQREGTWSLGVKLASHQVDAFASTLHARVVAPDCFVLTNPGSTLSADQIAGLRQAAPNARIYAEVVATADLPLIDALDLDGLVAKGNEAGGRVGPDSSLILLQRLTAATDLPVIAQGGVGFDTVAAFRAGGAAGVFLDWQLALFDESCTPPKLAAALSRMDGSETRCLGGDTCSGYRVFWRADHPESRALEPAALAGPEALQDAVAQAVSPETGTGLWLMGQDAAFATVFRERHRTLRAALDEIAERSVSLLRTAQALKPLARGAPFAQAAGIECPIVQGPMTRVSDRAEFAKAVADQGALPFLALALMRRDEASPLVAETKEKLGDSPRGVGILGFVDDALREEQTAVILEHKPDFALIAGGRPEQALELEKQDIPTFLHVPSPGLLKLFLEQGARRFIFEGRECGGHVGPRSSAVLWQQAIDVVRAFFGDEPMDCDLLFAGGIHDTKSAAMVSALCADVAQAGARVAALIGSAYILTREACETGAILPAYQKLVLKADNTELLESAVGHATRVVSSPVVEAFEAKRVSLLADGVDPEEVHHILERFTVGRSRVASKGIDRNPDFGKVDGVEKYVPVPTKKQHSDGVYIIGQVAALHKAQTTIADLHGAVCDRSGDLLDRVCAGMDTPAPQEIYDGPGARIAITGIGTIMPKAPDVQTYWTNILDKVDAISEVPARRWDWRRYFDEDRDAPDKAYSKWGGFVDELPFDPIRYGIPPNSMPNIEPLQLLALEVVREALESAGYKDGHIENAALRQRTSVIIGVGGGAAPLGQKYAVRTSLNALMGEISQVAGDRLPDWSEDSFPGILLNVIAGRVANRFDLGGVNFTVDAACGSSIAAVMLGARELETGTSDMVVVGGVDAFQSPFDFVAFSKTRALSPRGKCRTFDAGADGIAISEGLAAIVMRPLDQAEADGDRIFAVLRGVAGSSDGKDLSLTAPRPEGQQTALRRAYARAGISPATVGLIEAHGTGTVVGDRTEIESLSTVFAENTEAKQFCGVGSVKSMIGHTKAAAGCAGLAKVALALHHRVLPPTLNVEEPNPEADFPHSPFYVCKEATPWLRSDATPRRAGVSAFGFGGTNFHAVLEEYEGGYLPRHQEPLRKNWSHELLLFSAEDAETLAATVRAAGTALTNADADVRLCDVAAALSRKFRHDAPARFALVADTLADAGARLALAADAIADGQEDLRQTDPKGAFAMIAPPLDKDAVAFLFPGQGSQYTGMTAGPTMHFPQFRQQIEAASTLLAGTTPDPLAQLIFPRPAMDEAEAADQAERLKQTNVAQPAIGAVSTAMLGLLRGMGLDAGIMAGHSFGELTALHAAGSIPADPFLQLAFARGDAIISEGGPDLGTMAAVQADAAAVEQALRGAEGITFANYNAPDQTVIAGGEDAIAAAEKQLKAAKLAVRRLPVACAFHSDFVAPARDRLAKAIAEITIVPPEVPVFANETAARYPGKAAGVSQMLKRHLTQPVNFMGSIEAMHDSGARLFIEVGPNAVLTRLTDRILADKPHLAVATDAPGRPGVQQLLVALAAASVAGQSLDLACLWAGRTDATPDVETWNLQAKAEANRGLKWMVDLANVRPIDGTQSKVGFSSPIEEDATIFAPPAPAPAPAPAPMQTTGAPQVPAAVVAPAEIAHPVAHSNEAAEIMRRHQTLMASFLDGQREVVQAFLSGRAPLASRPAPEQPVTPAAPARPVPVAAAPAAPEPPVVAAPTQVTAEQADAPAPQAAAVTAEAATAKLLALLADRTGYPPDMLGVDLNLEADLGIDSIKRVEVLAALRLSFLADAGEAAHALMGPVAREKTVTGIIAKFMEVVDAVSGEAPAPAAAPPSQPAPEAPQPQAAAVTAEAATAKLLALLADRTGYPPDMLGVELNLEADLGIDSIKRVEVLAALRLSFLADAGEAAHALMGPVAREKTVTGIIAKFMEVVDAVSGEPQAPVAPPVDITPSGFSDNAARRFVMQPHEIDMGSPTSWVVPDACYVVTEDRNGTAKALAGRIEKAGGRVILLDRAQLEAEDVAQALHGQEAAIAGVIHCASMIGPEDPPDETGNTTKSLYLLLCALGPHLMERTDATVVAASLLGGAFGFDDNAAISAASAGAAGLLKSVAKEWPSVRVRAVDLRPGLAADDAAQIIFDEAGYPEDEVEIGWQDGARSALFATARTIDVPKDEAADHGVEPGSVILVTGGARGITARCLKALATRTDAHFVLVGSSPCPADAEAPDTATTEDPGKLRGLLAAQMEAGGKKPAIPEIEHRLRQLMKEREIRATLRALEALGSKAEYRSCNVCDGDAFTGLVNALYDEFGRLDGVVHGAGLIEDKLIVDKTPDSFDRVLRTKTDSAFTLVRALRPDTLRFLIFFTSVAGRFGNRGQADYGAANEVVSKLARRLNAEWPTKVKAISWGPRDQGGMVSKEIKRQFQELGIEAIDPDLGARAFVDEIFYGPGDEPEVVWGLGPWADELARRTHAAAHLNAAE